MRRGQIFKKGQSWFLRYREPSLRNGEIVQLQVCKRLGPVGKTYRSRRAVSPLALKFLAPINARSLHPESAQPVRDFIERFVRQQGVIDGENPMRDTTVPAGKGSAEEDTYAYGLEEIQTMLRTLHEPARTVVLTAALIGLRVSEIRGFRAHSSVG